MFRVVGTCSERVEFYGVIWKCRAQTDRAQNIWVEVSLLKRSLVVQLVSENEKGCATSKQYSRHRHRQGNPEKFGLKGRVRFGRKLRKS